MWFASLPAFLTLSSGAPKPRSSSRASRSTFRAGARLRLAGKIEAEGLGLSHSRHLFESLLTLVLFAFKLVATPRDFDLKTCIEDPSGEGRGGNEFRLMQCLKSKQGHELFVPRCNLNLLFPGSIDCPYVVPTLLQPLHHLDHPWAKLTPWGHRAEMIRQSWKGARCRSRIV